MGTHQYNKNQYINICNTASVVHSSYYSSSFHSQEA